MSLPDATTTSTTGTAPGLTRRGVLAGAGAAAAGAALVTGGATSARAAAGPLRVGVLQPAGLGLTAPGHRLVRGLELGLAAGGLDARLDVRRVQLGFSGATSAAAELLDDGAQVVVAGISAVAAPRVAALCAERGAALVVAGVGAHVVTERLPATVHSSLQHWQAAFVLGQHAARRLGGTLFHVVAAPDAGYDSVHALARGFQAAGGRAVGRALTHDGPGSAGVAAAAAAARASGARVVAVSASGARATAILTALRRARVRAAVLVDPLAVEPLTAHRLGRGGVGLWSASSWTPGTDNALARSLTRAVRARGEQAPDAFTVLGHDTALLLAAGAGRLGSRSWSRLPAVLRGRRVAGARGTLVVDRRLAVASTPLAVRTGVAGGRRTDQRVVAHRRRVGGVPAALAALETTDAAAWVNEYLGT